MIPYNPILLRKFNAPMNVEICATVLAVKYFFKYIMKSVDRFRGEMLDRFDELMNYVVDRFLLSSDAI